MPKPSNGGGGSASVTIQTSESTLLVPEGGQSTFNVRLSARPSGDVQVQVSVASGDMDISVVSGETLSFTRKNYNQWRTVTMAAAGDSDTVNGTASIRLSGENLVEANVLVQETDNTSGAAFDILTDQSSLTVAEGGSSQFKVRLSADPGQTVSVTVGHAGGDPDLSVVSGSTYYFNTDTWNLYQTVSIAAAEDADSDPGEATFALSTSGAATVYVTAREADSGRSTKRIVIDPVSRLEGHLRIEVEVTGGEVSKAWSTATLYRGIEPILQGRSPLDAPLITQRLCGVCTYIHQLCSVRAIEDAVSVSIPDNARIVRNLGLGALYLHDHAVHFYHLHGLDWVDLVSALSADTVATEALAQSISPGADPIDFDAVKARIKGLADTGNLGPFANAYWGHSAYSMTPEENLLMIAHYLEALKIQLVAAKMMAILGGKNPHPQSTVVGGVTCGGELTPQRLAQFRSYLDEMRQFLDTMYLPDLKLVASRYPEWASIGSFSNFLAVGEFPQGPDEPADLFMPRGMILNGDIFNVQPVDESLVTEHVARSWYAGNADRHPSVGETLPGYSGLDTEDRYTWSKAPRYDGNAMEVGPLARVLVGYGLGRPGFVSEVEEFLSETGLAESDLLSTLGRTAARAIETRMIANTMVSWLDGLESSLSSGNRQIYNDYTMRSGTGLALNEAPRGALGHWIGIEGGAISHYQMVVPSTWNFGPRCANSIPGPLEQALVGVPVADPANPVEVLRVIHSYDPCLACAVHLFDRDSSETYQVKVL